MNKKTVVVGMSGGVDSSVSALLLKEQGYNVIGLFMKNWEEKDNGICSAEKDFEDVRRVCDKIDIPYYAVNYAKEYYERVFKMFLSEFEKGRTPNPDVLCNREIKFGPFLDFAKKIGADYIATGHYAGTNHSEDDWTYLMRAKDENKDQTYFLNQLNQFQLKDIIFPLKDIIKPRVREIAHENGLINYAKKDSTGICFIGERHFRQFLQNYLPCQEGQIIDTTGKVVGKHTGSMFYTLGQRRGLGIGGVKGGEGRWFVLEKDVKNNILIVSQGDESKLFKSHLIAEEFNWLIPKVDSNFSCLARHRHRQVLQEVDVTIKDGEVLVDFIEPQRAITPGQYVVLYDEEKCLGGGVIKEAF